MAVNVSESTDGGRCIVSSLMPATPEQLRRSRVYMGRVQGGDWPAGREWTTPIGRLLMSGASQQVGPSSQLREQMDTSESGVPTEPANTQEVAVTKRRRQKSPASADRAGELDCALGGADVAFVVTQ
eukprot:7264771-Pyramimonas_sp.AAC.1